MHASLAPSTYDFRRAFGSPLRKWTRMRHWVQLARAAELPYLDLMRYRRELRDDREFQGHLEHCLKDVPYGFAGLGYLYAVVRAAKPAVVVETGVASGMSSAHILRALAANGSGALHLSDEHLHTAWDDFCARHALRPTRAEHLGVTRAHSPRRHP